MWHLRNDSRVHRKAGVRWAVCTGMAGTNYHNSPDAQSICFEQHSGEKLSSLEASGGEQSQAVNFQKRKLQLLVFAHLQIRRLFLLKKWEAFAHFPGV